MNTLSDLELLLAGFNAASERRGAFQHLILRADGTARAVWHDHAEEFTPEQLQQLVGIYNLQHNRE